MLLGKHCGRHEQGHLKTILDDLEGGPRRDLGLAVADIPADQSIHGLIMGQIIDNLVDRLGLAACLVVGKALLQLTVQITGRREPMSLAHGPFGVNIQQFLGDLPDRVADLFLGRLPALRAQAVEFGFLIGQPLVAADPVQTVNRHIELVVVLVAYQEKIAALTGDLHIDHALEHPDAVIAVNDKIAFRELFELNRLALLAPLFPVPARTQSFLAKQFRGRKKMDPLLGQVKPSRQRMFETVEHLCVVNRCSAEGGGLEDGPAAGSDRAVPADARIDAGNGRQEQWSLCPLATG